MLIVKLIIAYLLSVVKVYFRQKKATLKNVATPTISALKGSTLNMLYLSRFNGYTIANCLTIVKYIFVVAPTKQFALQPNGLSFHSYHR